MEDQSAWLHVSTLLNGTYYIEEPSHPQVKACQCLSSFDPSSKHTKSSASTKSTMKYTFTLLAACAVGVLSRPLQAAPDSLNPRMTMYYKADVADDVDPGAEKAKRMTMYYKADVADDVDPGTEEKAKRMTMYYKADVADEVDPEAEAVEKAKRMTMYYKADVADDVDPGTEEKAKRMTMYYKADVADDVDPEADAAKKA